MIGVILAFSCLAVPGRHFNIPTGDSSQVTFTAVVSGYVCEISSDVLKISESLLAINKLLHTR